VAITTVRLTPRALAGRIHAVLRLNDPPARIALALAVGVFIGCTPFYGLQTLLSLGLAALFHLNKAATVTGTWLNLPWLAPFVYGLALHVGGLIVPDTGGGDAAALAELLRTSASLSAANVLRLLQDVSVALLIGTTVVGAVAAVVTYALAFVLLRRRRARSMMRP
jgi:uncharacterized protein (DUF2062 family)